jgi:membrane protease YdiL (CAAX protease family)
MIEETVPTTHDLEGNSLFNRIPAGRVGTLIGLLVVFAPLVIFGTLGEWLGDSTALGGVMINLAYMLSVLLATAVLRYRGSGWREIGLARPASWLRTVLLGIGTLVVFILVGTLLQTLLANIPGLELAPADRSSYDAINGNLPLLILYLVAAWTTIVFGEEMLFRAFLTNSLAGLFSQPKARWALALIGSSLIFGLIHYSWGLGGIIDTTIMGFVLGSVYLLSGRNLWVTIIAHGLANTLGFIAIFAGIQ